MAQEIERKFLVTITDYRTAECTYYKQGYITTQKEGVVRVRIVGSDGYITIKGSNTGATRLEFEYPIPLADAHTLLEQLCQKPLIEKYRYRYPHAGLVWEVDEFLGDNLGLVVAEVEIPSEEHPIVLPHWVGQEVTGLPQYYNSNLVSHPYKDWKF